MKRLLLIASLMALVCLSTAVMAVPVDFSALGVSSVDIGSSGPNPAGISLDGITFRYDDYGANDINYAAIGPAGITGTNGGSLIFDFFAPATDLNFTFGVAEAVHVDFFLGGVNAGHADASPTSFVFQNLGTFDQAAMFFDPEDGGFSISSVSYTPAAVPEPSSLVVIASGCGMALGWLRRRR